MATKTIGTTLPKIFATIYYQPIIEKNVQTPVPEHGMGSKTFSLFFFYETSLTLIQKPFKDSTREEY